MTRHMRKQYNTNKRQKKYKMETSTSIPHIKSYQILK